MEAGSLLADPARVPEPGGSPLQIIQNRCRAEVITQVVEMKKTSLVLRRKTADGGEKEPVPRNVTLANGNAIDINNIPLITFFRCIEKEVKAQVSDEQERKVLLTKLRAISRDPAFCILLSTPVGQILRQLF